MMKQGWLRWGLVGAIAVGWILRWWNLDGKPLWLDEVITAILTLGHTYQDVPLGKAFAVSSFADIFTLDAGATCADIVNTVSTQSVHPPLFFCWMNQWLRSVDEWPQSWIWKLRSLPAWFGVMAIVNVHQMTRRFFSQKAAVLGAVIMAVSPFAVHLSQEARHYTLPMLLVGSALLGLYEIIQDCLHKKYRWHIGLGWIAVNSFGFYVHYFFLLAFASQVITLALIGFQRFRRSLLYPLGLAGLVCLTYVPWLPTFLNHMSRPETDWMKPTNPGWLSAIAPLYQLPMGWALMVITVPTQPIWLGVGVGVVLGIGAIAAIWKCVRSLKRLWKKPRTSLATQVLGIYVLVCVVEFLAIALVLGKDITQVPRYNFIYFPAVCGLLGAGLATIKPPRQRWLNPAIVLPLIALISSGFVVANWTFQKPYKPDRVAAHMSAPPHQPCLVVMGYRDLQDVALGTSFGLALAQQAHPNTQMAFLSRSQGYESVWQELTNLDLGKTLGARSSLDLWIIAPGLRQRYFPPTLTVGARSCAIDPNHYHRLGIPYQIYRCR